MRLSREATKPSASSHETFDQRPPERIRHLHERSARADVHGQRTRASRLDIEMTRLAPALGIPLRTLEDLLRAEEVLDQAGIELKDDEETEVEKFREFLDQVSPEDFAAGS